VSAPRLREVTIRVPDLDAAVHAWRTGISLEAVVDAAGGRASIEVNDIVIVLVESADDAGGLAGIVLSVADLPAVLGALDDALVPGDEAAIDPASSHGVPVRLVEEAT
jgi:hypothetical protein